jgi:ferredoxin
MFHNREWFTLGGWGSFGAAQRGALNRCATNAVEEDWENQSRLRKEELMPELEVEGAGTFDVDEDRRLVLAIKEDAGVNIMHSCEGYARCSTCRVEFLEGDPEDMTQAELRMLEMRDLVGEARLSCQILCEHDMKVRVLMTVESVGASDPGGIPTEEVTPEGIFDERPY